MKITGYEYKCTRTYRPIWHNLLYCRFDNIYDTFEQVSMGNEQRKK